MTNITKTILATTLGLAGLKISGLLPIPLVWVFVPIWGACILLLGALIGVFVLVLLLTFHFRRTGGTRH